MSNTKKRKLTAERACQDVADSIRNQDEAVVLLELIDAEFRTDPSSVACFDLRIVERVRKCVQWRKDFNSRYPLQPPTQ